MKFKYLKGSENDFEGAEDCHLYLLKWRDGLDFATKDAYYSYYFNCACFELVSHREPITEPEAAMVVETVYYDPSIFKDVCEAVEKQNNKQPEKLGHGLDCEECGPAIKYGSDKITIDGLKYKFDKAVTMAMDDILNKAMKMTIGSPTPSSDPSHTQFSNDNHVIIETIISDISAQGPISKVIRENIKGNAEVNEVAKSILTVNITAEDMKPAIDKAIAEFTNQPLELSVKIKNGKLSIVDQYGRAVSNDFDCTVSRTSNGERAELRILAKVNK